MGTTIEGNVIRVSPPELDLRDFLEYAELAIMRYGWRQGERVTQGEDMLKVAESEGLSLHDAVGFTNEMLGGDTPGVATGKDRVTADVHGEHHMREEMAAAVSAALPPGSNDKNFNDNAANMDEVLAVLRKAREGVA